MRDIKRIDKICKKLAMIWKSYGPDMRLGQFISNFFGDVLNKIEWKDVWNIEDERESYLPKDFAVWDEILDKWLKKVK